MAAPRAEAGEPGDTTGGTGAAGAGGVSASTTTDAEPENPHEPLGPGLTGMRGLYRMWSAETYAPGSVVFSTALEFFHLPDFIADGDTNSHGRINIALSGTPVEGLELSGGVSMVLNENSAFFPNTTLSLGDPFIGVRYGEVINDWFAIGGGFQLIIPSGAGVGDLSFDGTSFKLALNTDFKPVPDLLVGLHLGYHFDQSSRIFDYRLNDAQFFSAGINPSLHQIEIGVGISYQIDDIAAPYLEYFAEIGPGAGVGFGNQPQRLALGSRFWPLDERTLNLLVGVEIGVGGASAPAGQARTPIYNLVFGVAWDFGQTADVGPGGVKEVVKIKRVEVPADENAGTIDGKVIDGVTGKPVQDARIVLGDADPFIVMSDRKEGRFKTPSLKPGPTKLTVSAEGYLPNVLVALVKKGKKVPFTVKLQPATGRTVGTLKGTVRNLKGEPLKAKITIPTRKVKARADEQGTFALQLETGLVDVLISHKGYLTQRHKIRLRPGEEVILNVELYPRN